MSGLLVAEIGEDGKICQGEWVRRFYFHASCQPLSGSGLINNIGTEIAKNLGVGFYFKDFRPGFKAAHNTARAKGMYCQNYCGCVFSEKEQIEKKKANTKRK